MAVGGSHVANAQAMAEAVEAVAPGRFTIAQREIMRDYGFERFDDMHKHGWRKALERPWSIVWGQRLIDASPKLCQLVNRVMLRRFARRAAEVLSANPPKLVVANHPMLCVALTQAQRDYGLRVPVLTYQSTTLDATSLWAVRDAQRMALGSPIARDILARMGVPEKRMDVVGYPVRQGFLSDVTKERARESLGLDAELFTVLVAVGGEGIGGYPVDAVRTLRALDDKVQQVLITGRNPSLLEQLRVEVGDDPLVRVHGFVENMWDYLSAADLFVGKTGPATTLEVLSRGCPLVATANSGANENRIARWLEQKGLGRFAPGPEQLRGAVDWYRRNPARLETVAEVASQWDFPGMFERVGRYIAHFAETGKADTSLCGPGVY